MFPGDPGLIGFIKNISYFLNTVVVPFILALAGLIFLWNLARYFIIQGAQDEARTKAKRNAFWGILAFVLILSVWGIVNILVRGFGFWWDPVKCPDYIDPSECETLYTNQIFDTDINWGNSDFPLPESSETAETFDDADSPWPTEDDNCTTVGNVTTCNVSSETEFRF